MRIRQKCSSLPNVIGYAARDSATCWMGFKWECARWNCHSKCCARAANFSGLAYCVGRPQVLNVLFLGSKIDQDDRKLEGL